MLEAYATAVILVAFVGEALFGFGGGIVAVPLLSFTLEVRDAVLLTSLFQFLIGALVFRNLASIPWKLVVPVMIGMGFGVQLGMSMLGVLESETLRLILALFILAFLARSIWFADISVRSPSTILGIGSGILSGFFQGCIGVGGPNLVIYLRSIATDKAAFRAAMIFLLSAVNLLRVVQGGTTGMFSPQVLRLALIALPFFLVGITVGQRFHHTIPEKIYSRVVHLLLVASAISLFFT
jgi:uncharacterized membrane protein YfcA